jgi:hypothetical protein
MPIADRVERYSVYITQNSYLSYLRSVRLSLESGSTAFIAFPAVRPADWLQFDPSGATNLYMTADQFDSVYHLLQSEAPVYFTALSLFGLMTGGVHTELDLAAGEPPGEGDGDPQTLEEFVRRARMQPGASVTSTRFE